MATINAKIEFIQHTSGKEVICAVIFDINSDSRESRINTTLTTGYTIDEYNTFLNDLNFDYDNGYGSQELFGTIWYKDGTWSSREDYDGSEWWDYNECPPIPDDIRRRDKEREQKLNNLLY